MTSSIPLSSLESSPSAKFTEIGDSHVGRITGMEERQQTNTKNEPLTFNDGSPRMLWVFTLEKPDGEVVALYAKGGKYQPASGAGESMLSAIGTAARKAGAKSVEIGAELAVAFTGLGEKKPGQDSPKLYTAQYRPPAASVPVADLFSKGPA
jgi:hypothetical protein